MGQTLALVTTLWLAPRAAGADETTSWPPVRERLAGARTAFAATPTNAALAVALVQICFEVTLVATNAAEKAKAAEEGIATARKSLHLHPQAAALEYYLGLNLGQLASTRGMSALKLVREMETHLLAARRIDPEVSNAGPDRSLGYLYLNAPGWPLSVGSHDRARTHFEHAIKLVPDRPEHHLALAEACLRWKKPAEAALHVAKAEGIWPKAKEQFSGPQWQRDWADWESRLAALKRKLKPQ